MKQEYASVINQYLHQTFNYVQNLHREKLLSQAERDKFLPMLSKISEFVEEITDKKG